MYAFPQVGVQPLRAAYRALIDLHRIDAVVLVDGGTDILMRQVHSEIAAFREETITRPARRIPH